MKVEIWDGPKCLYRNLIDTGDEVMRFSDYGFITKSQCKEHGWSIRRLKRSTDHNEEEQP